MRRRGSVALASIPTRRPLPQQAVATCDKPRQLPDTPLPTATSSIGVVCIPEGYDHCRQATPTAFRGGTSRATGGPPCPQNAPLRFRAPKYGKFRAPNYATQALSSLPPPRAAPAPAPATPPACRRASAAAASHLRIYAISVLRAALTEGGSAAAHATQWFSVWGLAFEVWGLGSCVARITCRSPPERKGLGFSLVSKLMCPHHLQGW